MQSARQWLMPNLIHITDLERAINFWRDHSPATGEEARLCREAAALAEPYAMMIVNGQKELPADALGEAAQAAFAAAGPAAT